MLHLLQSDSALLPTLTLALTFFFFFYSALKLRSPYDFYSEKRLLRNMLSSLLFFTHHFLKTCNWKSEMSLYFHFNHIRLRGETGQRSSRTLAIHEKEDEGQSCSKVHAYNIKEQRQTGLYAANIKDGATALGPSDETSTASDWYTVLTWILSVSDIFSGRTFSWIDCKWTSRSIS